MFLECFRREKVSLRSIKYPRRAEAQENGGRVNVEFSSILLCFFQRLLAQAGTAMGDGAKIESLPNSIHHTPNLPFRPVSGREFFGIFREYFESKIPCVRKMTLIFTLQIKVG